MAVAGFVPFGLFAFGWVIYESHDGAWRLFAILSVLFAVLTVYATSMIYATLRTIRAWFNRHTVRIYLAFAIWTGSVWFNMLAHLFDLHTPGIGMIVVVNWRPRPLAKNANTGYFSTPRNMGTARKRDGSRRPRYSQATRRA